MAACRCVCEGCYSARDCPLSHKCLKDKGKRSGNCVKAKCQTNSDCADGWCCSPNHECVPPNNNIQCQSSDECKLHFTKTNCHKEYNTCMGDGVCGPNICRENKDCYHGHYCFFG